MGGTEIILICADITVKISYGVQGVAILQTQSLRIWPCGGGYVLIG